MNLAKPVLSYESIGASTAIDRTAPNYLHVGEKVQKIKKLISTGTDNADIAKFIPETLELVFQGMLEEKNTKEQSAHISYKDMESLDCQIMLPDNYCTNPNSMHICFPIKF